MSGDGMNEVVTFNLSMPKGFHDNVEATFPDSDPFRSIAQRAAAEVYQLVQMRWYTAVTGAMRWEQSQEAAIVHTNQGLEYL
jgi:hypothetical protein